MPSSDGSDSPSSAAPGLRRFHRKSRNGCEACKSRRIKCDERKPCCSPCLSRRVADQCRYVEPIKRRSPSKAVQGDTPAQIPIGPSPNETSSQPAVTEGHHSHPFHNFFVVERVETGASSLWSSAQWVQSMDTNETMTRYVPSPTLASETWPDEFRLNEVHMRLLRDVLSSGGPRVIEEDISTGMRFEIIRLAFNVPYLMHALLAHAALHLSATIPEQREMWDIQATGLHTTSVSLFNAKPHGTDEDSSFAAYLFSTLSSKHALYHVLSTPTDDLDSITAGFTGFLRLQRSAALFLGSDWQRSPVTASRMHAVLQLYTTAIRTLESAPPVAALLPLHEMLSQNDSFHPALHATYLAALRLLNLCYAAPTEALSAIAAFHLASRLDSSFAEELERRVPEALVILAYYAVIWDRHRGNWLFGEGGGFAVRAIGEWLGEWGKGWMSGAMEMVGRDGKGCYWQ